MFKMCNDAAKKATANKDDKRISLIQDILGVPISTKEIGIT